MKKSNREPISQEQQDAGLAKDGKGSQHIRQQIAEQLKLPPHRQPECGPFFDGHYTTLSHVSESNQMGTISEKTEKTLTSHDDDVMTPFGLLSREDALRLLQNSIDTGDMDQVAILSVALGYQSF